MVMLNPPDYVAFPPWMMLLQVLLTAYFPHRDRNVCIGRLLKRDVRVIEFESKMQKISVFSA